MRKYAQTYVRIPPAQYCGMVPASSHPLTGVDGAVLARLATEMVRACLMGEPVDGRPPTSRALRAFGSSFVTLERAGTLRGCIGTLEAVRPLYRDVARNAGRAMVDPRLEPVTPDEWPQLEVSVSVLSRSEPLAARGLTELCALLRPHVDGLILTVGSQQATFLPTVWERLPDPADFIAALLDKGGWAHDRLPIGALAHRYTASEFHDGWPREPL
jgi:uncharacterized protein